MYSESYSDEYSDNDQSLEQMERSPVKIFLSRQNHHLFVCPICRNELRRLIGRNRARVMILVVPIQRLNYELIFHAMPGTMELTFKAVSKVQSHRLIMPVHKSIFGEHREEI